MESPYAVSPVPGAAPYVNRTSGVTVMENQVYESNDSEDAPVTALYAQPNKARKPAGAKVSEPENVVYAEAKDSALNRL